MMGQLAQEADQGILSRERRRPLVQSPTLGSSLLIGFSGPGLPICAEHEGSQRPFPSSGAIVAQNLSATAAIGSSVFVFVDADVLAAERQAPQELQTGAEQAQASPREAFSLIEGRITGPVRLIAEVFRAWNLTNEELATLLDYSGPQLADDLLRGRLTFLGSADREDRVRILYSIHDTLSALFVDAADEGRWMRTPIPALGDVSPVAYMMERRIPGMIAVWQLVERRLANR